MVLQVKSFKMAIAFKADVSLPLQMHFNDDGGSPSLP